MRTLKLTFLALLIAAGVSSCKKDIQEEPQSVANKTTDLKVSDGFNWSTSRNIQAEVVLSAPSASGLLSKVTIYRADPNSGAQPIASGSAGFGFNYNVSLMVPTYTEGLWIMISHPDGTSEVAFKPLSGDRIDHTFQHNVSNGNYKVVVSGPDCNTGCDEVISGSGSVTINGGKTYCVTSAFNGSLNFQHWSGGGTVRVCGTANVSSVSNMGNNCHIVVADGGTFTINSITIDGNGTFTAWQNSSVTIGSLSLSQSISKLVNYSSDFQINNNFSPNCIVENYGTMDIAGDYNSNNGSGSLTNAGTLNIADNLSMNNALNNSGTINVGNNLNLNANKQFTNTCHILVQNFTYLNAGTLTMNGGYLKSNNTFQNSTSGILVLQNQSMLSAVNVVLNNSISGGGSKNTVKSTGNATINNSKQVSGAIEWADDNAVLTNGTVAQFVNGATFITIANATNYVPVTPCNPEGFGVPPITDTDGDGVGDPDDEYPLDPLRAYNNYYPSATTFASMAFEDLWPSYGDFDMNDLVVDIRFNKVTNAQNQVVDLVNTYVVKAVGGSFHNGFAFQLDDIDFGAIQSVTGTVVSPGSYMTFDSKGLETGTDKPVVVVWDNTEKVIHRAGGSFFNTLNNGLTGTSDTVTITVNFSTPQISSAVGLPPYNHFIIINQLRGKEVHLPGYIPTSKADISVFGTFNDDTNPGIGKYYKSTSNLPWAIFIAEEFAWPLEKADIVTAHLKFAEWAQSSGALYPDWYMDNPGYRNNSNIYGN